MPFGVYFVTHTHALENKRRSHAAGGTRGYRFVLETYGRLGRAAVEVLGEWADAAAGSGAFDRDAYLTWVKRELSVTFVRGNARLFKKFVGVLTRGFWQRFVEGMDVPVLERMCVLRVCACGRVLLMSL